MFVSVVPTVFWLKPAFYHIWRRTLSTMPRSWTFWPKSAGFWHISLRGLYSAAAIWVDNFVGRNSRTMRLLYKQHQRLMPVVSLNTAQ